MPRPSKHRAPFLTSNGSKQAVSLACATGDHKACNSRVRLPKPDKDGRRYKRCGCSDCRHPAPTVVTRRKKAS